MLFLTNGEEGRMCGVRTQERYKVKTDTDGHVTFFFVFFSTQTAYQ